MSIKIIAVDMDGTFLNDQMSFDRKRFSAQYSQLKERGIKFVVASGNQYYQLISFFLTLHMKSLLLLRMVPMSAIRILKFFVARSLVMIAIKC